MIGERRKILTMLHEKKINVDEAEGLLDALEHTPEVAPERKVEIITGDNKTQQVLTHARWAAPSNLPVLIVGETGTGKELVALTIHQSSPRRDKPFLSVNCASLPEPLLHSEIFGHERGAFTGALLQKTGLLHRAQGGTLFLDEIGELPVNQQVKLLRFLERGEYESMGGTGAYMADVRIIACTNASLEPQVQANSFRRDLFDRLSVVLLEIPSLRNRPGDIPLLADYFLKKHAERIDKSIPSIAPETLDVLAAYPWPGNVRELEKVIAGALVLCDSEAIQVAHLPEMLTRS